jgi:carbonic anhydrase
MSCLTSNAPINIATKGYTDDCSLKCDFKYNYPRIPVTTIKNEGNHLAISYDKVNVNYNNNELKVEGVRIYTPSLHTYNGAKADGEMVITHMDMGFSLLVCIPISLSSTKNEASKSLMYLIDQAAKQAPNMGEEAVVTTSNFTLNPFIPKKSPLYSYQATLPYAPCNGSHQYIVFMPEDSPIFISATTMSKLNEINTPHDSTIKKAGEYFFNKRGAVLTDPNSDEGDDIFIDCQPVGIEGKKVAVPFKSDSSGKSSTDFNNPMVIITLSVFGGGLVIYILSKLFKYIRERRALAGAGAGAGGGN